VRVSTERRSHSEFTRNELSTREQHTDRRSCQPVERKHWQGVISIQYTATVLDPKGVRPRLRFTLPIEEWPEEGTVLNIYAPARRKGAITVALVRPSVCLSVRASRT